MMTVFAGHIFKKYSNIRFHENLSCWNQVVTCEQAGGWMDGWMDRHIKNLVVAFHSSTKKGIKIPPKDLCTWWSLSLTNYISGCLRNTELQNAKFITIQCEIPHFMLLQVLRCSTVYTSFSTWCSHMRLPTTHDIHTHTHTHTNGLSMLTPFEETL